MVKVGAVWRQTKVSDGGECAGNREGERQGECGGTSEGRDGCSYSCEWVDVIVVRVTTPLIVLHAEEEVELRLLSHTSSCG